jgi:hypothetical protein
MDQDTVSLAASLGFSVFYFCTIRKFSESALGLIKDLKAKLQSTASRMQVQILSGDEFLGSAIESEHE